VTGYGNIAPKTFQGRCAVILYALPGIPLCVTFLGLLGNYMAVGLKVAYFGSTGILYYLTCKGCACLRSKKPE
jgi:hypothetical protein